MEPPRHERDDESFSDSDLQWFDRLSGRPVAVSGAGVLREADALRRALELDRNAAAPDSRLAEFATPEAQSRRWERLLFRLRKDGLLDARPARRRAWFAVAGGMAAAALAVVVLLPRMQTDDKVYYDEPPTLRGELTLVRRQDTHPRQAAEALAAGLGAAGLRVAPYQQGQVFFVDVHIGANTPAAGRAALAQAGLVDRAGLTRIEVDPR